MRKKTLLNLGRFFREIVGATLMNVNLSVCTEDKTFFLFIIKQYVQNVQSSFHKIIQNKPKCFACFFCECQVVNHWTINTSAILEHPKRNPGKVREILKGFLKLQLFMGWFHLPYFLLRRSIIISDRLIIDIINSISHMNLVPNFQSSIHFSKCSVHQKYISFEVLPISFGQV